MARRYGHEKVSLFVCLRLLADQGPLGHGAFVELIRSEFGVAQRTSKDATGVLAAAGYATRQSNWVDGRTRTYSVSERGYAVLEHVAGPIILRFARQLFSTCASPATLKRRAVLCAGRTPKAALADVEHYYLDGAYAASLAAKQQHRQLRALRHQVPWGIQQGLDPTSRSLVPLQ
jgi:DNA-binding MarR family transcriptional regulator